MTSNPSAPAFVYRLATPEEWLVARKTGVVAERNIDKRDGYLHLSTKDQVLETARLHFADAPELLALEIPLDAVAAMVKFELAPKRGELFPHLYGALRTDQVAGVIKLERAGGGFVFGEAF